MSPLVYITLAALVIVGVQCAVIRVPDIPVQDNLVMKVVIREGGKSNRIASIKIDLLEKEPKEDVTPSTVGAFVPDFSSRNGIAATKCPNGQRRRGPVCI